MPVRKSKCKKNYLQQKIKQLLSEDRLYSARKHSDTACPNKQKGVCAVVSSIGIHKSCVTDQMVDNHSDDYILSYFSKGEKIDYNCKVWRNNEKITCSHFSYWWVNKKNPNFDDIDSPEKIIKNNDIYDDSMMNQYFYFNGCPSVAFYFEICQFPKILHKISITLKEGEEQRYLLVSINHIMGLAIKKRKGNVIILYYDPNDTLRNKRIIVGSENNVKHLKYDDFFSPIDLRSYFPDDYKTGCLLSTDTKTNQSDCQVECLASPSVSLVHLLNEFGHYGHARSSPNVNIMVKNIKYKLLTGQNKYGMPALLMAAQHAHHEATKFYIETVFNSYLELGEQEILLAGKTENGTPALLMAAKYGHYKFIKVYVETVSNSKLPLYIKERLLAGKNKMGIPALFAAIKNERYGAVKAYFEAVSSSNIPSHLKEQLLAGKTTHSNTSILSMALQDGDPEMTTTYIDNVLDSKLRPDSKERLLADKNTDGVSALFLVLKNGHNKATKVYVDVIFKSNFDLGAKDRLLAI
ncbi:MAG: ShET2/EspL2 family type III secretion system effector toxin [Endozoicomonadaceae bacterium]|nr:ShET2/EspL2 family type III secretion system effector toxin [Endozoicomonadaceae bacterium]